MALRHALKSLPQLAARDRRIPAGARGAAIGGSGGCEGRALRQTQCKDTGPPPPCPPCTPAPRPCCRHTMPPSQYRLHVYCRPPPAGRAPPCPTAPPACPRSCSNYRTPNDTRPHRQDHANQDPCDAEAVRDRVWRRLEDARAARREAYLQDVHKKEENVADQCGEGYYSADGHSYHRDPPPAPRTPPPPHLVPRPGMRSDCVPHQEPGVLACEHRPSVTVTVLRDYPPTPPAPPSTQDSTTSAVGTTSSHRDSAAGDRSWCDRPIPLASPQRCSGASFAERLRRRAAAPPPCKPLPTSKGGAPFRELHTCESHTSLEEESRKLTGVIERHGSLHEAGRGRQKVSESVREGRAFVGHVMVRAVSNERPGEGGVGRGGLRLEMSFDNDLFNFDTKQASSTTGRCPHCSEVLCGGRSCSECGGSSNDKASRPLISSGGTASTPSPPQSPREVKSPVTCGTSSPPVFPIAVPLKSSCARPVNAKVPSACKTLAQPAATVQKTAPICYQRSPVIQTNKGGADPCATLIKKIFEARNKPDQKKK